jgi:hypothetical protein
MNIKSYPYVGALLATAVLLLGVSLPAQTMRNLGTQRVLFLDDSIIETLSHARHRLNPAKKVSHTPIIEMDRPWEGPDTRLVGVFFDHRLGKFRMRYTTGRYFTDGRNAQGELIIRGNHIDPNDTTGAARVTCEAFSEDGITWEKPNLGLVEFQGSTANNILPESAYMQRTYIFRNFFEDLHESDPRRRYKGMTLEGTTRTPGMKIRYFYSPDAYRWTSYEKNPVIDMGDYVGIWGPTHFLGWDPIRRTYAVHMENNLHTGSVFHRRRSIGRAESPDMVNWSEPETIVVVDDKDYPDTEFYGMPATFYENLYFGFLWVFSTNNTQTAPHLAFSKNGIDYNRTYREAIIPLGAADAFDSVVIYAQEPIFHNGEIYCYYYAANWRSPEQLEMLGDRATAGIGLAKLPQDGFVSLEGARTETSVVTTRSFSFTGKSLYLNLQTALQQWGAGAGEVRVELLDGRHNPIPGFGLEEADTLSKTGIDQQVSWQGRTDLSDLAGKPLRLKIHFRNAKLYAFQFR